MAVVNGYTDRTTVKNTLKIDTSDGDDNVDAAINAASRAIDEFCGRRFWQDVSDRTAYFNPHGGSILWFGPDADLADLASLTSLAESTDGVNFDPLTVDVDFHLSPRSLPARKAVRAGCWPSGSDTVEVVGRFGIATPPDDVTLAATMWASRLLKRSTEAPMGAGMVNMNDDRTFIRPSRFVDGDIELLLRPHRLMQVAV